MIQRKRLKLFFGYEHRFEAYLPKERRVYGYFALPVLVDGEIVAAIDFKTDREAKSLLIQKWTWIARSGRKLLKRRIEEKIDHFEKFQPSPRMPKPESPIASRAGKVAHFRLERDASSVRTKADLSSTAANAELKRSQVDESVGLSPQLVSKHRRLA